MSVIIFGAGKNLWKLEKEHILSRFDIVAIFDNDENKIGKNIVLNGKKYLISSPNEILKYNFENVIISIQNQEARFSIAEQLVDLGVPTGKIKSIFNGALISQPYIVNKRFFSKECIVMDVTNVSVCDTKTGIPRTINNLYKNMKELGAKLEPVQWMGKYITSNIYVSRANGVVYNGEEFEAVMQRGNRILFPDTSWSQGPELLVDLSGMGVHTYVVVYDIIPIIERKIWNGTTLREIFIKWIDGVLKNADNVLCITKTVADDVIKYYRDNNIVRNKPLKIFCFHLGFNIQENISKKEAVRNSLCKFVEGNVTFLMVGVLGPQKNHLLALRAFKQCLKYLKDNIRLLIIGRDAYDNVAFKDMYYNDKEINDNVMWIDDADDDELRWAYQNASALLFPTKNEGFGLPLVEAAYYGLPILCSDIRTFREIAGENAEYFKVDDVDALVDAIRDWVSKKDHPNSKNIKLYDWNDSAKEVVSILNGEIDPYVTLM